MRRPGRGLVFNPTLQLTALVDVSRRTIGRRQTEIADARVVRFLLSKLYRDGRPPRLDKATRRQLVDAGVLIPPSDVPGDVHLDPRIGIDERERPSRAGVLEAASPVLSPGCFLHRGPHLPPGIGRQSPIAEPFLPREEILWVRRSDSGIALPYTLEPGVAGAVRNLLSGRRARPDLARQTIAAMQRVGAFEDPHAARSRRAAWRSQIRDWRRELHINHCVALRGLFTPIFLAAVREYYRRLEAEGYVFGGDRRRAGGPLLYDEPVLSFLGGQLASVVRQVTGERAPWTFSYLRVFGPGAVLASHRDVPVCRWNIDLVVGGEPAPERRSAWPLWVDGRRGARPIRLGLGDGLLYRGAELRHERRPQPALHTTVLAALHYGRVTRRSSMGPAETARR